MIRLKSSISFLGLVALTTLPTLALASGRVGNGGYAYVCRDQAGSITSARLLDLWEAEGVPTWRKDEAVESQIDSALTRLKSYSPNAWVSVVEDVEKFRTTATESQRPLESTEDAFPSFKPAPGCGYEQVARYEPVISETGKSGLRIAAEIFHSPFFSKSDQAALFVHEAIYFADRERNAATNSLRTRMIVAHLFSGSMIPNSVRLATAATLLGEKRWDDFDFPKKKITGTFLAVPDPSAIRFKTLFTTVDGINADNLHTMTPAKRAARYRCTAFSIGSDYNPLKVSSPWLKLSELIGTSPTPYNPNGKAVRIESHFSASEFVLGSDLPAGAIMENSIILACEKRDPNGKVRSVSFGNAVFVFPDAESLYVMDDGSLRVFGGNTPMPSDLNSTYEPTRNQDGHTPHQVSFSPEIVRGIF